jgi:hypothetical protein
MSKLLNKNKIIPLIEIFTGVILLIREIYQMTVLPSIHDSRYELVDFFKYKENTYSLMFVWVILLLSGFSYWINRKLYWIFTQILLITIFSIFLVPFCKNVDTVPIGWWIISIFTMLAFITIEVLLYRQKILENFNIDKKVKVTSIILGISSSIIYWIIEDFMF